MTALECQSETLTRREITYLILFLSELAISSCQVEWLQCHCPRLKNSPGMVSAILVNSSSESLSEQSEPRYRSCWSSWNSLGFLRSNSCLAWYCDSDTPGFPNFFKLAGVFRSICRQRLTSFASCLQVFEGLYWPTLFNLSNFL